MLRVYCVLHTSDQLRLASDLRQCIVVRDRAFGFGFKSRTSYSTRGERNEH